VTTVMVDRKYWESVINFDAMIEAGMIERSECAIFQYAENAEEIWTSLEAGGLDAH
jgi:hypothetical protein